MTDQYRIIGQLESDVKNIGERTNRIETKLDVLTEYIQQQKGGARIIWAIAGVGGIAGVAVTKLVAAVVGLLAGKP